ncbi:flagellar hook-length control protein FliK [Rhizobium sp. 9140]|uniref:flagellar hook-length control protein FliK n=1 Tax=Rhizobium sp. 9140 TaxID=1761900 RepID=UPI00079BD92E|nr:flagellar hook-length control protein FliK [Rhizobium sp. 9140]CZT34207.1 hook-length control protein FliK [Rhizobium sp. 9140]
MRSLDDMLPAAKAARASVSAVKNRQGEAEGGAAFRKAFADLGHARDTNAKTHVPAGHAKTQSNEQANVTPSASSATTAQAGTSNAAQPRASGTHVPTPSEAEHKSEQTLHAATARGTPAATSETSREPSKAPAGKTDALALLSLTTADQPRDADGETVDIPTRSADEPSGNRPAPETKVQATVVGERIEGKSVPAGNPEKAPVATASTTAPTRPSAAATLSATLALKAIKADPEATRAENVAAAATAPADDETKVGVGKSLDTVETPSKAVWKTKENMAAPLVSRDLETQAPVARLRAVMPERTAKAASVETATMQEVSAAAPFEIPREPASAAVLANAANQTPATADSKAGSEPAMPALVQALAAEKTGATPPSISVEAAAEKVPVQVAVSPLARPTRRLTAEMPPEAAEEPAGTSAPLARPTRQLTAEMPPEAAEEPAAASVPDEEVDIRSLMAILGPAVAQPVADTSARTENIEAKPGADAGMPGLKLAGDRITIPMATMAAAESSTLPTSTDATDQVFRFARADGKASPISLRADADRPVSTASNDQANTKAETVTVLEARRYLGIAPTLGNQLPMTANAQAVAAAITGNGDPTQGLQANTGIAGPQGATGKVVNTLKIQMHPIDLGLVTATLRLRDDELQIDLRVQTGDAYRQLTNDQDAMIKALRAQGFQVDQVNVIFTPSDSSGGNDGSGQPQSNQQQPSQNGRDSQGGLAAGNGGEGRNGGDGRNGAAGQRSADDGRTRQDTRRETPAAPQPGLSDELYF